MHLGFSVVNKKHIVIIGCGAAGGTAAQFARKTDRKAQITIIEQGPYPHYSKCGIPYAISGSIPSFSNLIEFSTEWFAKARITLMLNTTASKIDHNNKKISIKTGTKSTNIQYTKLILAPGAHPLIPPISGIPTDHPLPKGIHPVRTIDHGEHISQDIQKGKPAIIIGAGLIGLEMADALTQRGMKVTVIETLPYILANSLDEDMAQLVHQFLTDYITVYPNHTVQKIEIKNNITTAVHITDNTTGKSTKLPAALIILATGTRPNTLLAQNLGCRIGSTGGIHINNKTETS